MWMKLFEPRIWRRIYVERMGEPLIYNVAALFHFAFGSVSKRVEYDCIPRQPYAYGILLAANHAKAHGLNRVTLVEFGVATGAGLLNICWIAAQVTRETGVDFDIVGFDSGEGMPPPIDYRDHPEKYFTGDFPMVSRQALIAALPPNARILFGPIGATLETAKASLQSPIGFVSVDVDYYSSTKACLGIFNWDPSCYLPSVPVYFDDVQDPDDNEYCGELLAIKEFNSETGHRKITPVNFLSRLRVFKHAVWHEQMYYAHILDHEHRSVMFNRKRRGAVVVLSNPQL